VARRFFFEPDEAMAHVAMIPPVPSPIQHARLSLRRASEALEKPIAEAWLLGRLAFVLLGYLGLGFKWIGMFCRLMMFVWCLTPGFARIAIWYCFTKRIRRNIRYGPNGRNLVDIYFPPNYVIPSPTASSSSASASASSSSSSEQEDSSQPKQRDLLPVVVFISGGAWIIGYKAWSASMGKLLSEQNVIYVTPDYRNFPQGSMRDMLEDVDCAMTWVFEHIEEYGGDPKRIYLVGQSAGAHLGAMTVLNKVRRQYDRQMELAASSSASSSVSPSSSSSLSTSPSSLQLALPPSVSSSLNRQLGHIHISSETMLCDESKGGGGLCDEEDEEDEREMGNGSKGDGCGESTKEPNQLSLPSMLLRVPTRLLRRFLPSILTPSSSHYHCSASIYLQQSFPPQYPSSSDIAGRSVVCSDADKFAALPPNYPRPTPERGWSHHDVEAWDIRQLKGFVGVSGPYDLLSFVEHLHSRGLNKHLLHSLVGGRSGIAEFSPARRILNDRCSLLSHLHHECEDKRELLYRQPGIKDLFPHMTLIHGTADTTCPSVSTELFAAALRGCEVPLTVKYYQNKSHTDPLLEDPMGGSNPLIEDLMELITGTHTVLKCKAVVPEFMIRAARWINPFA